MVLPIIILPLLVVSSLATSPVRPTPTPPVTTPPIKPKPIEALCECNEKYVRNSTECRLTCANRLVQDPCGRCKPYSGCVCKKGFVRLNDDATGPCVTEDQCPPEPEKSCPENEVWSEDKIVCPPQSCASIYSSYNCENVTKTSGCNCIDGYLRDDNEVCIPNEKCSGPTPVCGENEVYSEKKITCPPQSCEAATGFISYLCAMEEPKPGCNCKENYLRDANNVCIPAEECPPGPDLHILCGPNEEETDKKVECPPETCETIGRVYECPVQKPKKGCKCIKGYLRNSKGECIPKDKCEKESDTETTESPTTSSGDPCGPNGTYVDCGFRCPNQYCPQDDSGVVYACKPGRPCPPGCGCKINYLRKDYDDDRCILASDCPPVECTKPNEVWDSCPSDCLSEQCENVNDPPAVCNTLLLNCQPKCVCQENHYRNSSGICVPASECPIPPSACTSDCTPTCAVPSPPDCPPYTDVKRPCCEHGYILDKKGGKCIPIEDCPKTGCNGDPNAVIRRCPIPCVRSTCAKPESQGCPTACTPGCECAPGYILPDYNGKCIKVEECPGGNPCGPNAHFVNCKSNCPTDYCPVDDNRATIICETYPFAPCFSGCVCNLNHKLNNRAEEKCIVSSDCPPVNCTRPNEVWNSCPSDCQSEYCEAAFKKPVVCNTLVLNCQPRCVCKKNHFRNDKDICIPAKKCPKPKKPCDSD